MIHKNADGLLNKGLFSSASEHWATPRELYLNLHREFTFTLDPCRLNSQVDGLTRNWSGERVYCNPPYGPKIRAFLNKWQEAELCVFLLPARTDTKWFHEVVLPYAREIRFLKGRLHFNEKGRAPFPSMVVVFNR